MVEIINNFYSKYKLPAIIIKRKLDLFDRNPDIEAELAKWIETGCYTEKNCVVVNGYSAKKLAEEFPNLNGDGAFVTLAELREKPEKIEKGIKEGFKMM